MAQTRVTREQAQQAKDAYRKANGVKVYAAQALGLHPATYNNRLRACKHYRIEVSAPHRKEPTYGTPEERNLLDDLKQQVKTLTDTNKHLADQVSSTEQLKAFIHDCKQYRPQPPRWLDNKPSKGSTGTPVLVASDWHWGETVRAAELNGRNAYNREIATTRAKRFFTKAVELLKVHMANPRFDRIVCGLLGDMVSGYQHEELSESNWSPINVTVMELADQLIAGFDLLLKHFPQVYVPCVVGNHGRIHKGKPRYKGKQHDNFEWTLYHLLARHYRAKGEERIYFDIADSPNLPFTVYKTRFLANHGDSFRGGSGASGAWSPIIRGDLKMRKQHMATAMPYDCLLIGHWHTLMRLPGNIRVNGSLKGWDEYAMGNGLDHQLPMQDLFIVHPQYGITAEWPIYLETQGTTYDLRTDQPILPKP